MSIDISPEALLDAMSEAVYVVDRDRTITYWNRAAEVLTGYLARDVVGRRCRDGVLNHVDDEGRQLCRSRCPLLATMRDGQSCEALAFLHHCDGHRVPVAVRSAALRDGAGEIVGAVEVFHDDSRSRALAVRLDDAEREALTDPLTGLGNRRMLGQMLRACEDEYRRYGRPFAVLFADIDHFKRVNDRHGHDAGDRVLQLVGATLRNCTRPSDVVGRWGGEEFLLLARIGDETGAVGLADRMRRLVGSGWINFEGQRLGATLSIGAALVRPGEGFADLVARADGAMLAAKSAGRDRTVLAP